MATGSNSEKFFQHLLGTTQTLETDLLLVESLHATLVQLPTPPGELLTCQLSWASLRHRDAFREVKHLY